MFGRSRRDKHFTRVALEAQAEWAALSEIDKRPLREAFEAAAPRPALAAVGGSTLRAGTDSVGVSRTARAASVVRNLPARFGRTAPTPVETNDTMIVTSSDAWRLYKRTSALICEAERAFRPVRYVAFSVDGALQREVPRIIAIRDAVPFTSAEQRRLMTSGTELDLRLADVIATARRLGLDGYVQQVYLLTAPLQTGHVSLPTALPPRSARRQLAEPAPGAIYGSVERLQLTQ